MRDKAGDQADAQLEQDGLGRRGDVDRVEKVCQTHPDRSRDAAVKAPEKQCGKHAERVADVDGGRAAARHGDANLQEGEGHIAEGSQKRGLCPADQGIFLLVHGFILLISYYRENNTNLHILKWSLLTIFIWSDSRSGKEPPP